MSLINLDLNTAPMKAKIQDVKAENAKVGSEIESTRINFITMYGHFSAMSNQILHIMQTVGKGTELGIKAQKILQGAQIITTGLSIEQTVALATTFSVTNPWYAALLYSQAVTMGVNLIRQQIQYEQTEQNEEYIAQITDQMEAWS